MTDDAAALSQAIVARLRYAVGKRADRASVHDWYVATALAVRDRIVDRWLASEPHPEPAAKRVYYFSVEFLIGRLLTDALTNLGLLDTCRAALAGLGVDFDVVCGSEPDAALGNGGLGRLAACFMESMASVGINGFGYGIRYDHGLFRQVIRDGWQIELPEDWLESRNPWELERDGIVREVGFGGRVEHRGPAGAGAGAVWIPAERVRAVAYDTPIVGWRGARVNTLRLWSARPVAPMQLDAFNRGQIVDAFAEQLRASAISRVLYPDDSTPAGRELRLKQEFFFVSASLQDLLFRHARHGGHAETLPEAVAIQLNDTHPALAVAELVRLLVDEIELPLAAAFDIARATLAYTNHTLLPEALESWPVPLFERLLPRHMQIIYAINVLHLERVAPQRDTMAELRRAVSLIDENHGRHVRMGHLAFIGAHAVNGVSALHGRLMRETVFRELDRVYPGRITHVTNGITFRRWLAACNPGLASLITEAIGDAWIGDARQLDRLLPLLDDAVFRERFAGVKRGNKQRLVEFIAAQSGVSLDPDAMVDVQIKRMHEYKRQLLNILETIALYEAMRAEPGRDWVPRVKVFAGKAAASYHRAKLIIKLINDAGDMINHDPAMRGRLAVVFLPNYSVSLAELIVTAADLSEQISTAGMEASGTGNMKLALNGAVTIGTLDGANIEIRERVGAANMLIFGLSAEEVAARRESGVDPGPILAVSPMLAETLDAVRLGVYSPDDPGRFAPLVEDLVTKDHFMVAADFAAYAAAQREAERRYRDRARWTAMALRNTVASGWFSSDRAIRDYAMRIWGVTPSPD